MTDNRDELIEQLIARVYAENALAKWYEEGHLTVPVLWEVAAGVRSLDEEQRRHLDRCSACGRRLRKIEHALAPAAAVSGSGVEPEIGEVVFAVSAGDQAVTGPSAVAELERVLRDGIAGWSGRFFGEECLLYHAAREAVEAAPRRRAAFCQLLRLYEKLSSPISYGDLGMEPPYWEQAGHLFRAMVGVAKAAVGWIDRPDAALAARAAACFDAAWPAMQFPLPPDDTVGKDRTNLLRACADADATGLGFWMVADWIDAVLDRGWPDNVSHGKRMARMPVLFVSTRAGNVATLTIELASGHGGFYPNPTTLGMTLLDETFQQAMLRAWAAAVPDPSGFRGRWSVTAFRQPGGRTVRPFCTPVLRGRSLEAAASCCVREAADQRRRLTGSATVSATLGNASGSAYQPDLLPLGPVADLAARLRAARDAGLKTVVVAQSGVGGSAGDPETVSMQVPMATLGAALRELTRGPIRDFSQDVLADHLAAVPTFFDSASGAVWEEKRQDGRPALLSSVATADAILDAIRLHRITGDNRHLERAAKGARWLDGPARHPCGGIRARDYGTEDERADLAKTSFSGRHIYAFGNAVCLQAFCALFTRLGRAASRKATQWRKAAMKTGQFLLQKMADQQGEVHAVYDAGTDRPVPDDASRWSRHSGPHLVKVAEAFVDLADLLAGEPASARDDGPSVTEYQRRAATICARFLARQVAAGEHAGAFETSPGLVETHPHCHAAEAFLRVGRALHRPEFADAARRAATWALDRCVGGEVPQCFSLETGEPLARFRTDSLAQTLCLSADLLRRGELDVRYWQEADELAARILALKENGVFAFGHAERPFGGKMAVATRSCWTQVACLRALWEYQAPRKL